MASLIKKQNYNNLGKPSLNMQKHPVKFRQIDLFLELFNFKTIQK